MSSLLLNAYAFNLHCTEVGISLLSGAIKNKDLPNRTLHCSMLVIGVPMLSVSGLLARIGELVSNILFIPFFFCATNRWATLKFRLLCVMMDSLHLFTEVIRVIMRVAASAIGLVTPYWAVHLWKGAEQIEAFMLRGYAKVAVTGTKKMQKQVAIPLSVHMYLRPERALRIHQGTWDQLTGNKSFGEVSYLA